MASKETFEGIDKTKHGKLINFMSNSYRYAEVGGKQVIQTADGEFVEYTLMEEEFFVDNWLMQFAIGNVADKNYFNHEAWSKLSDGFTKGVIVINSEQQPVCLIRKFIDMDLNETQEQYMSLESRKASVAKYVPNEMEADQIVQSYADAVELITGQNPDYDTLTAMIPWSYYLSHGINPTAAKNVMYIKDVFNCPEEDIDEVQRLMYKNESAEVLTAKEKAFISKLTQDTFIFNDGSNKVEDNNSANQVVAEPEEFDPFAD